jgi:hypothetical protein
MIYRKGERGGGRQRSVAIWRNKQRGGREGRIGDWREGRTCLKDGTILSIEEEEEGSVYKVEWTGRK